MLGIVLMIGGLALLTLNDALAKWLSATYPVGEIVALRSGFIVLALGLFLFWRGGPAALKPVRFRHQALRSACFIASTFAIVTALSRLPLADVVAFTFASPLFIVALAGPLLGEYVVWRRWLAVLVGFAGVLVMARPTPNAFQWAACIALTAALFSALRDLVTRHISAVESSNLIVWYSMLAAVTAGLLSILVMPWRLPSLTDTGLFAINAAFNGGAHFMMIEAYRRAEASVVAPFRYTALLWGILFGFLLWGDMPGVWLLAGAMLVMGSGLYLFYYAHASY